MTIFFVVSCHFCVAPFFFFEVEEIDNKHADKKVKKKHFSIVTKNRGDTDTGKMLILFYFERGV